MIDMHGHVVLTQYITSRIAKRTTVCFRFAHAKDHVVDFKCFSQLHKFQFTGQETIAKLWEALNPLIKYSSVANRQRVFHSQARLLHALYGSVGFSLGFRLLFPVIISNFTASFFRGAARTAMRGTSVSMTPNREWNLSNCFLSALILFSCRNAASLSQETGHISLVQFSNSIPCPKSVP